MSMQNSIHSTTMGGLLALCLISGTSLPLLADEDQRQSQADEQSLRLKDLAGRFKVAGVDSSSSQTDIVPAEVLGLSKGDEIVVEGNELRSGEKLLATLTTDFSATGLDLDKAVHVTRRPVLLTLPSGKGLLCAYELQANHGFDLVYPHTMGRVSAGTWLYLRRLEE